jgi:hypothetical protein
LGLTDNGDSAGLVVSNGVLVGAMVALAGRLTTLNGLRLAVTQEGWLRLQEGAVSVPAVLAWMTNPLLLVVVVLLEIGQSMTGRRLRRSGAAQPVGWRSMATAVCARRF